ncbi:MAG: OmpA family protein [Spirochaetales bacterium]|nr:OmpA family protein [Spirochaetales bacterium]
MKRFFFILSGFCLLFLFLGCQSAPEEPVLTPEPEVIPTPEPEPPEQQPDTNRMTLEITALSDCLSPNNDGFKDKIAFKVSAEQNDRISSWKVEIKNVTTGKIVKEITGMKMAPESTVGWDGTGTAGTAGEGKYSALLTIQYDNAGKPVTAESNEFVLDISPPEIGLNIKPLPFSPDGDNVNDYVTISFSVKDVSPVYKWEIKIYDENGEVFHTFSGTGKPEKDIVWDGINSDGHIVEIATDYKIVLSVTDNAVNTGKTEKNISVDVLLEKINNRYKIKIGSIIFRAYQSDFHKIEDEILKNNVRFFNQLHRLMKKYPQYVILIEGHAMMPQNRLGDKKVFDKYNKDVLIPLSKERAEAVKKALIKPGIDGERIKTDGIGASRPLVPHDDLSNREKNRRVEFYLVKD